jgi:hypothetical protein
MTVDEIKERCIGHELELDCPACGALHLTREDALRATDDKVCQTPRFQEISVYANKNYAAWDA